MKSLNEMRLGAELLGETYTSGHMLGWIVRDDAPVAVDVRVTLVPGWSGRDHLFDLTLAAAAEFLTSHSAGKLPGALSHRNGRPSVRISDHQWQPGDDRTPPAWVVALAEATADAEAKRSYRRRLRECARELRAVRPIQVAGGKWILTDDAHARRNDVYGVELHAQPGNTFISFVMPTPSYDSEAQAAAAKDAFAAHIAAQLAI